MIIRNVVKVIWPFIVLLFALKISKSMKSIDVVEAVCAFVSLGCPGEASGATHPALTLNTSNPAQGH